MGRKEEFNSVREFATLARERSKQLPGTQVHTKKVSKVKENMSSVLLKRLVCTSHFNITFNNIL